MAVSEKTALRHQKWKREILDIIRRTPEASRIQVKRLSGLSMDVTLTLIGELLDEGLILPVGKTDSGKAGRKATLLEINPEGAYFIGVRFSAAGISGVLMNFACSPAAEYRAEFSGQPEENELVAGIITCIDTLIAQLGSRRSRLRGIGLGAPGIIEQEDGCIVRYAHIPSIRNLRLRQIIEDHFHIPAYLEHGVKCSARAAISQPEFSSARDLLFMQTGRGIHMCVIIGGRIHRGMHYLAGEIGHMLCNNGQTLESLTSSDALCRLARQAADSGDPAFSSLKTLSAHRLSLENLLDAAASGSEGCRNLLMRAGEAVGAALSSAIMLVNPQDIVLNGTICASPFFEESMKRTLAFRCIPESLDGVRIRLIASDPRQDATGAAMIPFHMQFSANEDIEGEY